MDCASLDISCVDGLKSGNDIVNAFSVSELLLEKFSDEGEDVTLACARCSV